MCSPMDASFSNRQNELMMKRYENPGELLTATVWLLNRLSAIHSVPKLRG